jgi:hypothetical protein
VPSPLVRKARRSRCGGDAPLSCFKGSTKRHVRDKVLSATSQYPRNLPPLFDPCRLLRVHPFDGDCFVIDETAQRPIEKKKKKIGTDRKEKRVVGLIRDGSEGMECTFLDLYE